VDEPPSCFEYQKSVADVGHIENKSGTEERYVPYSTTKSKIKIFDLKCNDFKSYGDRVAEIKISNKKMN
jgi:hypothetical protein